jgi:hypothetical protein
MSQDDESECEFVNAVSVLHDAMFSHENLKYFSLNQRVAGSIPASPTNQSWMSDFFPSVPVRARICCWGGGRQVSLDARSKM